MAEIIQTLLSFCVVSAVVLALGGSFCFIAWRSVREGRASIRGMVAFDRAQNPSAFSLVVFLYLFGGGSFLCFAALIFGSMGLYVVEKAAQFFLPGF